MSEFFIQEKQLSSVTRTIVTDELGRSLYLLVGRWGNKGDVLSLYTMGGDLVASIKQVSFVFGQRFELYEHYQKVGSMRKIFNWPGDFYYIKQLKWRVHGDIYHHNYHIHYFSKKIMKMSKASTIRGNFYVLNVTDDQDGPKCICIAAVLDYWLYNRKKEDSDDLNYRLSQLVE